MGGAPNSDEIPLVLVVDDRQANLLALESLLAPLPIKVVRAASGKEALHLLLRHEFALVLLDVEMPILDGLETATEMKSHPRTAGVPIIFITAVGRDEERIANGFEHGAVDYVMKPFDATILKAKVMVFVGLYEKQRTIRAQAQRLRERELEALDRKQEERYTRLADALPLFAWATKADGRVYYVNRAWTKYSGLDAERTSVASAETIHPDDVEGVRAIWTNAVATGTPAEMQCRIKARDGSYRWYLVRALGEQDDQGATSGFIVTATDIDGPKLLEEARERALRQEVHAREAAEAANRIKDDFIANVSHELRTPLNAILGWSQLLRGGTLDDARKARAMEVIERNARAQAALIEDLLDVSRIVTGQLRLRRKKVDAAAIVQDAVDSIRPVADAREVLLSCDKLESQEIDVDPDRLSQIVCNLITNAIKFTPKGGRVEVEARRRDDEIEILVRDTGPGISADFLPHVFDRFSQGVDRPGGLRGGLGLGLAIVRHLAGLHGGRAEVANAGEGAGAVFKIALPIEGPPSAKHGNHPTDG